MKIQLWWIGKTQIPYIKEGIKDYSKRINRLEKFSALSLVSKHQNEKERALIGQSETVLAKVIPADYLVLLDECGQPFSSREFAAYLEQKKLECIKNLIFLIGGPYGFHEKVLERADYRVSLSSMTFPHDLVRLLFLEQLYRAITISRNHPYHHD